MSLETWLKRRIREAYADIARRCREGDSTNYQHGYLCAMQEVARELQAAKEAAKQSMAEREKARK